MKKEMSSFLVRCPQNSLAFLFFGVPSFTVTPGVHVPEIICFFFLALSPFSFIGFKIMLLCAVALGVHSEMMFRNLEG